MEEKKDMFLFLSDFEKAVLVSYLVGALTDYSDKFELEFLDFKFPVNKAGYEAVKKKMGIILNKSIDDEYIRKSMELCAVTIFGMVMQFAGLSYDSKNDISEEYRKKINDVLQRTIDDMDFLPHLSTMMLQEAKNCQ